MKPVLSKTIFLKSYVIEIAWFWGWFKDLFTFRRRTKDNKLFAIRRFYVIPWSREVDRDAISKAYMLGPMDIHILKTGRMLFLQDRGFDNKKRT